MGNVDKVRVKGEFYNIVSPSAFGDYIETIGGACTNPNGYAKDAIFLAKTNEVQNLYQATQAIAFGANIVVGTNCKQTTLDEVIKSMSGASTASDVSYSNTSSGLTATDAQAAIDEVNGKTNTNANNISSLNSALTNEGTTRQTNDNNIISTMTKNGAHNLLSNDAITQTINGVTFTVNNDGSITANGTCNGEGTVFHIKVKPELEDGIQYVLTGCPKNSGAILFYSSNVDVVYNDYGDGVQFTKLDYTTYPYASVGIYVPNGTTLDDAIFKPMIRLATDSDTTYQPYSMTNQEITPYVQAISNRNLIDNAWFTVNQRGQASYTEKNKYSLDRWICRSDGSNPTFSVSPTSDGVSFLCDSDWCAIYNYFEPERIVAGKTYTLSVLYSDGTIKSVSGVIGTYTAETRVLAIPKYDKITVVLDWANPQSCFNVGIYTDVITTAVTIRAIKLELGSVSTLAMDTAPNYGEELRKCQRYYQRLGYSSGSTYEPLGSGFAKATNLAYAYGSLKVKMRQAPTVGLVGKIYIQNATLGVHSCPCSLHSNTDRGTEGYILYLTPDSQTLTAGEGITAYFDQSASGTSGSYLEFSADL